MTYLIENLATCQRFGEPTVCRMNIKEINEDNESPFFSTTTREPPFCQRNSVGDTDGRRLAVHSGVGVGGNCDAICLVADVALYVRIRFVLPFIDMEVERCT